MLPFGLTGGIGGIGFVGWPVAHGLANQSVFAHELGHNLDLPHAPCGGAAGADPDFPYPGAGIGTWGYDIVSGATYNPGTYKDLMSYCGPEWISDYNFANVTSFREAAWGYAATLVPDPGEQALTVSGTILGDDDVAGPDAGVAYAEAAPRGAAITRVQVTATATRTSGDTYSLVGRDASGRVLFTRAFEAYEIADGPAHLEGSRGFTVSLVVPDTAMDRLASLDVLKDGTTLTVYPVS